MYQIFTFRRDVDYDIHDGNEPLPPTVEKQFNAWAMDLDPEAEIIHVSRQEYSTELSGHTVLTVLVKLP